MKQQMAYRKAFELAQLVVEVLKPGCVRLEVAGSLRRKKAEVGDIEIVAIPRMTAQLDLFGESFGERSALDDVLLMAGVELSKNGPRFKQFESGGTMVDLFVVTPETWGVLFTLRTGSEDFSHWLVTSRLLGGAMPNGMRCADGRLWKEGELMETPEEADVFKMLGLEWMDPEERVKGFWWDDTFFNNGFIELPDGGEG